MAGTTGLEPAASAVTGQRSNQLNYVPTRQINQLRNRRCFTSCAIQYRNCRNRPQRSTVPGTTAFQSANLLLNSSKQSQRNDEFSAIRDSVNPSRYSSQGTEDTKVS